MERHQHAVVKFLSHLGQVWLYASHKPELLTTSMMVFGRQCPTIGDETISIASYCFQFFSGINIKQQECCVNFCDFSGFVWTFLCMNWVFNSYMCIIQIWIHAHAPVHINWLKNQICVLGCMLRSDARNGNEFQTPGHRWLPAKCWDTLFLNSSKSKTHLKFMKLGML